MRYQALATDYDGTLATQGEVDGETIQALLNFQSQGRKLILLTGRELEELFSVFPGCRIFHRIVAENGAVLYDPLRGTIGIAGEAPPYQFLDELKGRNVKPLRCGRVIVSTRQPHATVVQETINEMRLSYRLILNKNAVMVLPAGVDKVSGLLWALRELDLTPQRTVGVGDAENDLEFLSICGLSVAVENALPVVRDHAHWTTMQPRGTGVQELISRLQISGELE